MARVPTPVQANPALAGRPPLAPFQDPDAAARRAGATGRALGELAGTIADTYLGLRKRQDAAREETALSTAITGATRELGMTALELDRDPVYATRGDRFDTTAADIRQRYMGGLSPESHARFTSRFEGFATTQGLAVRRKAHVQEIGSQQTQLVESNRHLVETALGAEDPLAAQTALDQIADNLNRAQKTGIIDAAGAARFRNRSFGDYDLARAERLMAESPGDAADALSTDEAFPNIDPVRRETMRAQAMRADRVETRMARTELRQDIQDWERVRSRGDAYAGQQALFARAADIDPGELARLVRIDGYFQEAESFAKLPPSAQGRYIAERYGGPLTGEQSDARQRLLQITDRTEADLAARESVIAKALAQAHLDRDLDLAGRAENFAYLTEAHRARRHKEADRLADDLAGWRQTRQRGHEAEGEGELIDRARDIFGDDIAGALQEEASYFDALAGFAAMSPRDQAMRIEDEFAGDLSPTESERRSVMERIYAQAATEWQSDPVAYLARRNEPLQQAYAAFEETSAALAEEPGDFDRGLDRARARVAAIGGMLQAQELAGIAKHDRRVLPRAGAKRWSDRLAAGTAPELVQQTQGLAERYGPYWPQVYREIADAGSLPASYRVLAGMTKLGQETAALALAQALETGEKHYRDLFEKRDIERIDEAIAGDLTGFREQVLRLPRGEGGYLEIEQAARMLAFRYTAAGDDPDDAAEKAVEQLYSNHYTEATYNDARYRVPNARLLTIASDRDEAMDKVKTGLRVMTEIGLDAAFATDDIDVSALRAQNSFQSPEDVATAYRSHLQSLGRWVTSPDERGLILTDEQGQPVLRKNGKPLELEFRELANAGERLPALYRFGRRMDMTDTRVSDRLEALGFYSPVSTN